MAEFKDAIYSIDSHYDSKTHKTYIDADKLNLILELHGCDQSKEEILNPANFKLKLQTLISKCVITGSHPWKNPNCIIGEAPGLNICYDKEKIAVHQDDIRTLFNQLRESNTLEDLKTLKTGQQWTVLNQYAAFLLSLLNAAEILDFNRCDTTNPKLILIENKKKMN